MEKYHNHIVDFKGPRPKREMSYIKRFMLVMGFITVVGCINAI